LGTSWTNLKNESIVKDATGIVENVNVSETVETVGGIISGFIK
jgi:hypothetical protein